MIVQCRFFTTHIYSHIWRNTGRVCMDAGHHAPDAMGPGESWWSRAWHRPPISQLAGWVYTVLARFTVTGELTPLKWYIKETRWSPRTRMLTRMLMVQMSKHMVMQSHAIPFCNSLFEQSCTCFPCYQSAVWRGKCRVWSVECEVRSVERKVWSGECRVCKV